MKDSVIHSRKFLAVLMAVLMLGSIAAVSAYAAEGSQLTFASSGRRLMTASELYEQQAEATVGITTEIVQNMFGYDTLTPASGSGFIITEDGYILTNYHVVEDAKEIKVALYNNDSYEAELIGYDESNDIAVLKIDADGLKPVTFGNSDELVIGEDVVAIGNPLGELTFSLTKGIVSALDRDVTLSGSVRLRLIQTDCSINAGNSGGALFNMYGEVVGITNAKYSGYGMGASVDNIGFAIPVNSVTNIVEQIMTKGEISSPYIGVSINNVSENLSAYGIPQGANVVEVVEDSPADEAGLKENDVITEANGVPIRESGDLVKFVKACQAGDEIEFEVFRQGKTETVKLTVGENVKSALPVEEAETVSK